MGDSPVLDGEPCSACPMSQVAQAALRAFSAAVRRASAEMS